MSYDNERYGGPNEGGNYGGGRGDGYGGGRGNNYGDNDNSYGGQSGGFGGESGRQHRRDDEPGYDDRREEMRQHGQSGYGSVGGPGGYGRGQEGYGGPGSRVGSDNPESRYGGGYDEGRDNRRPDQYSGGGSGGGYGGSGGYGGDNDSYGGGRPGGNGGYGHSSGTSYGDMPGGSDDYSSAAHTAAQHAGSSGDQNLFASALGMLSGHKAQNEDLDEQDAVKQHQQFYGGGDNPHPASSGSMGSAAAMQALKMFNGGGGGSGGQGGQGKNDFIGLAMSQAAKLFDQQSSQGNVHQSASKQDAISSAGQMALKMYMKSQGGGGGGGAGGLMSLASKFL